MKWILLVAYFSVPAHFQDIPYYTWKTTVPSEEACKASARDVKKMVASSSVKAYALCFPAKENHDGTKVKVKPETLCVHGDTPSAAAILQKTRDELRKASILVKPMGQ